MNGSLKILSIPDGRRRSSYNSAGLFGVARAQYHLDQSSVILNTSSIDPPEVMIGNGGKIFEGRETPTGETN